MNKKIFEQIMDIRSSGRSNMLDVATVQRIAYEMGFYDLVCFIEERPMDYVHFIMTGEMPAE